jgi:hypothetical protein
LNQNTLTNPRARKPLTRVTLGIGLALAAIGTAGLGSGVARAVPLQPLLVDDPLPVPTPAGPDPASPVNIANAIFAEISNVLSTVFPGSNSVLMPGETATSPLSPGLGNSGLVPAGEAAGLPGYPGAVPPGYPPTAAPGQAPTLSTPPGSVSPAGSVPIV